MVLDGVVEKWGWWRLKDSWWRLCDGRRFLKLERDSPEVAGRVSQWVVDRRKGRSMEARFKAFSFQWSLVGGWGSHIMNKDLAGKCTTAATKWSVWRCTVLSGGGSMGYNGGCRDMGWWRVWREKREEWFHFLFLCFQREMLMSEERVRIRSAVRQRVRFFISQHL